MKIFFAIIVLLSSTAFALERPGCSEVCPSNLQACGNECVSWEKKCEVPKGWSSACDYNYMTQKEARKAKCCHKHQGVVGCAGQQALCGDGTLSDTCGCEFILLGEKDC